MTSMNIRAFNNQASAFVLRQRVAVRRERILPRLLESRFVVRLLLIVLAPVAVSLILSWRTGVLRQELVAMQTSMVGVQEDNITLRASRAGLMSKTSVARFAALDLQLFIPEKDQVHRVN